MDPQQTPPAPRPEDTLDFLNSYNKQPQKPKMDIEHVKQLGWARLIGFGTGILILIWAIAALIFGGGGVKRDLISIVAQQDDLIRVNTLVLKNARDSDVAAKAANMSDFLTTDRKQISTYILTNLKDKAVDKEAAKLRSTAAETKLNTAYSNNRLDKEFSPVVGRLKSEYKISLTEAKRKNKEPKLEAILDQALKNIDGITL